jgi:hypothetical protein
MEKRVMSTPSKLQFATQQAAHWLSQNPTAVRVALFVAPVAHWHARLRLPGG